MTTEISVMYGSEKVNYSATVKSKVKTAYSHLKYDLNKTVMQLYVD